MRPVSGLKGDVTNALGGVADTLQARRVGLDLAHLGSWPEHSSTRMTRRYARSATTRSLGHSVTRCASSSCSRRVAGSLSRRPYGSVPTGRAEMAARRHKRSPRGSWRLVTRSRGPEFSASPHAQESRPESTGGNGWATHHPATAARPGSRRPPGRPACSRSGRSAATSHKRHGYLVMKGSGVRVPASACLVFANERDPGRVAKLQGAVRRAAGRRSADRPTRGSCGRQAAAGRRSRGPALTRTNGGPTGPERRQQSSPGKTRTS
jgi:hypothetical protein